MSGGLFFKLKFSKNRNPTARSSFCLCLCFIDSLHAEDNLSLRDIHMTLTLVQFAVCGEKKRSIF